MHRFSFSKSLICATLGIFTLPALAAFQPVSEAALAGESDRSCHFNADTSYDCTSTYRYTILTNNGREMISRIDFSFPESDRLEVIKAESTQPGAKPVPLADTQIDTRMAPNPDQGFLRLKQTSIAFPNLRIGTMVSYTLREHTAAKPLNHEFHYVWVLPPNAVRMDRFKSSFSAEKPIVWRSELMDDFSFTPSADNKSLVIEQKAPRFVNYVNEAGNAYSRNLPRVELGSSTRLQDYFGDFARRYTEITGARLPAISARAVAGLKGLPPEQQVSGLMQHIHDNYRYLGDWRASDRGYVPFTLAEIEDRGYGDCKDLAVLLTAMLNASGIDAQTTWVSRGNMSLGLLLPGTSSPNHAIVRARVNGKVWWLDPTNPVFSPGRSMPDIQDRWALVIDPQGTVRQEHIPQEQPVVSTLVRKQEHFNPDGTARTSADIEMSQMRLMRLSVADTQSGVSGTDQDLCDRFSKEQTDCTITRPATGFVVPHKYQVKAELTDLRPLKTLSGQSVYQPAFMTERWDDLANYRRTGQKADLYLEDPETMDYEITLSGLKVAQNIKSCTVRSPWFDMDLNGKQVEGQYRYQYRLTQKQRWLSHDDIMSGPFDAMLKAARNCNNQMQQVVKLQTAA